MIWCKLLVISNEVWKVSDPTISSSPADSIVDKNMKKKNILLVEKSGNLNSIFQNDGRQRIRINDCLKDLVTLVTFWMTKTPKI